MKFLRAVREWLKNYFADLRHDFEQSDRFFSQEQEDVVIPTSEEA